jgi:lipoprotein-anchoring transpeptidase ErfK/SrfK
MRAGSVLEATTSSPVSTDGCRGGWFELRTGGFVCNGTDVIAFEGRRLPERRPAQPDFEEPLPYRFARTRRDNTPMYRRLPTDLEAAQYEGYRIPGMRLEHLPDGGVMAVPDTPAPEESGVDGPGTSEESGESTRVEVTSAPSDPSPSPESVDSLEVPEEARVVRLNELQGERDSVLQRRLVKGFIVSLDRDMRARARRYWRTLSNGFVPYSTQVEVRGSDFHGVELAREESPEASAESGEQGMVLPVGYVLSSKTVSYTRGRDGRPRRSRAPGYHHVFQVTGNEMHRDREYVVATNDVLFERRDVTIIEAREPPSEVGPGDHWIDIDLSNQSLVAYEGRTPVYVTLVSTGRVRDPDDPLRDMRTPTGLFRITSKHVTNTMDGDHAVDGPYSIEDVPYVMYFQLAYALHSAFWHDGFGRPRSHGCVNLAPLDARWIFNWAGPALPSGWHGAYPTEEAPGTWLWIHGETPQG